MITQEQEIESFHDRNQLFDAIAVRDEKIVQLSNENLHLKEQLAWFKRQVFGKRSERIVADLNAQQLLFEGFESISAKKEEKKIVPTHTRSSPKYVHPNKEEAGVLTYPIARHTFA